MTRPILLRTLESMIFRSMKKKQQSGEAYSALCQLIGMVKQAENKTQKYKRLRRTHLNLIDKQRKKIEILQKEIEYLKEQRHPTPQSYTIDKPNYDPNGFDENDLAHAIQTNGFQIPRF